MRNLQRIAVGQVDVAPGELSLITTDNLATITSPGYLNNQSLPTTVSYLDIVRALYSFVPGTGGTYAEFQVSISAVTGVITLVPWVDNANVLLPVVAGNIPNFNGITGQIKDAGIASNVLLTSAIVTPDVGANLIAFDIQCGFAALAAGGSVPLITSSGAKQYKIRSLQLNGGGINFSGGGDRLGQVTDGTTVYSVIPGANLQTLVNAQWGSAILPNPATAALNANTAAGANLVFKYSGGTTDYTAGSVIISGVVQRVA
jgi:hypothetical protein